MSAGTGIGIYLADMNNDGKPDVLSANRQYEKVSWVEINWDTNSLEPDFSIWILKAESEFSSSAFIKVYPEEATVQSILNITNVHLKVPFWTTN